MQSTNQYAGGENFDLRQILLRGRNLRLHEKAEFFHSFLEDLAANHEALSMRCISSAADREVTVIDPCTGRERTMIMFGSNNYLGLANHVHVRERALRAIREYGVGIGGPPLLNGYTNLHRELEERLAALKGAEDALVFSSGYGTNVGLVTGLINSGDMVFYDAYSHASFCDGIKMGACVRCSSNTTTSIGFKTCWSFIGRRIIRTFLWAWKESIPWTAILRLSMFLFSCAGLTMQFLLSMMHTELA